MRFIALKELDNTEGTVQLRSNNPIEGKSSELILLPRPSKTDPNDPLRWPRWKKHVAFTSVCAFTFLTNYGIGGLAPAFFTLSQEFNKTPGQTADLLLWPILVLGVFNFFWVPVANYFGKRPVFVFASLLLCVAYIWGACARGFESLLWSNIIAAFAGSSTEALGAAIVNDLYFLHERGWYMGIYMNSISGGNTIGPLICGFVVESVGWRWHKWMAVIFTGVNFVAVLLFVPETQYNRDISKSLGSETSTASILIDSGLASSENVNQEKAVGGKAAEVSSQTEARPALQIPKKTWLQEMSLWNELPKDTTLWEMFIRPFPLIVYPAVMFSFLTYAVSLAWVVAINILNPFILQAPPYNWKPSINGLINIPALLGNLLGSLTGGWLVDKYSDWRARKNNGIFQPESRLVLLIIPALVVPAGCLLFGYGVAHTMNWTTLFFGNGMVSVGLTAVPIIGMTYVRFVYSVSLLFLVLFD
ncbi:MFS general substrate transporter [Venturia nashicola]|uniref:MFS general substrate transporter n=1 Tax=Venturia nashicola TaxID=86259 RepID=A0A4Z1NN77_9PEZI|nr:MFS general substrate transporter [Venturia nashicola]